MKHSLVVVILSLSSNFLFCQTSDDNRAVLQMSLDIAEFQPFIHPEVEGRVPLVIFNTGVVPKTKGVIKFGSEVLFWDKEDIFFSAKKDYLIFEEFRIDSTEASVYFTFPFEGAYAKISLTKEDGKWVTKKIEVGEYENDMPTKN